MANLLQDIILDQRALLQASLQTKPPQVQCSWKAILQLIELIVAILLGTFSLLSWKVANNEVAITQQQGIFADAQSKIANQWSFISLCESISKDVSLRLLCCGRVF